MTTNKTLIKIKNTYNEYSLLSSFYTEKPYEFLRLYHFCKENDIILYGNSDDDDDDDVEGTIEEINVYFGGKIGEEEYYPCIEVYINKR